MTCRISTQQIFKPIGKTIAIRGGTQPLTVESARCLRRKRGFKPSLLTRKYPHLIHPDSVISKIEALVFS